MSLKGETYFAEFKGRKVGYEFISGENDSDVELTIYHQCPLNLGWYLTKKGKSWTGNVFAVRRWISKGVMSKAIEVPVRLKERGRACWTTEKMIGKALISSDKVITPIIALDEILQPYKGELMVDDEAVRMVFPYTTLFDLPILEAACRLSAAFTSSIMLPATPSEKFRFQKRLAKTVAIALVIIFILFIAWRIFVDLR